MATTIELPGDDQPVHPTLADKFDTPDGMIEHGMFIAVTGSVKDGVMVWDQPREYNLVYMTELPGRPNCKGYLLCLQGEDGAYSPINQGYAGESDTKIYTENKSSASSYFMKLIGKCP
jgi:hypothetical protein